MSEQTSSTSVPATPKTTTVQGTVPAATTEHRQSYGTAKTENLRDSGLWRILLPAFVIACFAILIAVPLLIMILLLSNSIVALNTGNVKEGQLLWIWIVMIVLEMGLVFVIIRGLYKVFLTQAGNYRRASH